VNIISRLPRIAWGCTLMGDVLGEVDADLLVVLLCYVFQLSVVEHVDRKEL
jgi:hypothetical protein